LNWSNSWKVDKAKNVSGSEKFVNDAVNVLVCEGHILSLEQQFSAIVDNLRQLVDPVV